MKNKMVQQLTRTALLLALCVVLQLALPTAIQAVKGPAVNVVLLVAAFTVNLPFAIAVAMINPIFVLLLSPPTAMVLCPQIVLVVMLGNATLVACAALLRKYFYGVPGLVAACLAKTAVMMVTIQYLVIPFFGANLEAKGIVATVQYSFGLGQLSTAAIGSVIFFVCWQVLKKIPAFAEKEQAE